MKVFCSLFAIILLIASVGLSAQTVVTQVPYDCGFEIGSENDEWKLNEYIGTGKLENMWHIGSDVASTGVNSLYVSADDGVTATYIPTANVLTASREFLLPKGRYNLAFDWMGCGDPATSELCVVWVDADEKRISSTLTSAISQTLTSNICSIAGRNKLNGVAVWRRDMVTIESDGITPKKLIFVWVNSNVSVLNPGGCVDNIEIRDNACSAPTQLKVQVDADSALLSWRGFADNYIVEYKKYGESTWNATQVSGAEKITIGPLTEGAYECRVKAVCDDKESVAVAFNKFLVYLPLCIDYVNLDSAKCMYGSVADMNVGKGSVGKKDYGYDDMTSRHTVHIIPGEKDPRAQRPDGTFLNTIPQGEIASVRIGNWEAIAKAEAVEYEYLVDSTVAKVMTLKYAIVLESPQHEKPLNPHFLLQIFDAETGEQIDPSCTEANYYAKNDMDGWSTWLPPGASSKIVWKDWTTLGINLANDRMHGKKIRIRVSIFGCGAQVHFAYAYFTLGCDAGELKGIGCGEQPTTYFEAPAGFHYKWYLASDPLQAELGDSAKFEGFDPTDIRDYKVDVMFPENHSCKFTLTASAVPRDVVPEGSCVLEKRDCGLFVECQSTSYVIRGGGRSDDDVEQVLWKLDGTTVSFQTQTEIVLPNDGQPHTITLSAGISIDESGVPRCSDIKEFNFHEPVLKDTVVEVIERICVGPEQNAVGILQDKIDTTQNYNGFGCDSITITHYETVYGVDTLLYDTICSDEQYLFGGVPVTQTGEYIDTVLSRATGCDSIVTLRLTVYPAPETDVPSEIVFCSDDRTANIPLYIHSGSVDGVALHFSADAIAGGFSPDSFIYVADTIFVSLPRNLKADRYSVGVEMINKHCGSDTANVLLVACYPSGIIQQKWNDVLALYNKKWNGGYDFTAYQWYVNDNPIPDARSSYLYIGENQVFGESDLYHAVLTRTDGVVLPTCKVTPNVRAELSEFPQLMSAEAGTRNVFTRDIGRL